MTRIEQLSAKLPEASCALITADINRRYFTGMRSSAGALLVFKDAAYLLIDSRYIEKAQATVTDCTVVRMTSMYQQINELLKKHSCTRLLPPSAAFSAAGAPVWRSQ